MIRPASFISSLLFLSVPLINCQSAERIVLTPVTWDGVVPAGKEVDCIYGDIVLRNDQLTAIIANPIAGRDANMTVRNVGGCVIDLTKRVLPNDQLSAFYPGANKYAFRNLPGDLGANQLEAERASRVSFRCQSEAIEGGPQVTVTYTLYDGDPFLGITTEYKNPHDTAITVDLLDSMRADRSFRFKIDDETGLLWANDNWWRQAYGVMVEEHAITSVDDSLQRQRPVIGYTTNGSSKVHIEPGESYSVKRKLIPANHLLDLKGIARELNGQQTYPCEIAITDLAGPIASAKVTLFNTDGEFGSATTLADGKVAFTAPPGRFRVRVIAFGRPDEEISMQVNGSLSLGIQMQLPGYVNATITDEEGGPIPCKVEFRGKNGTRDPYYGPDSKVFGVRNLRYSHNGIFRIPISPGSYDVIISHGNEYDAVFTSIDVRQGKDTELRAELKRTVNTTGWVSGDYHSHSSPSGDNTSSQKGRVLNLLAEHIEFGPCTEHNRVSSYLSHLREFNAEHLMATCSGMELTGYPLPVNHQNAFPLEHRPRTQDGGGPRTDEDPVAQIARLALWDQNSDKLVQQNHPNLIRILDDRDENGIADGGFKEMFGYMDVIEVHPPGMIFDGPDAKRGNWDNTMIRWMQLLNLGYRIPGVVNTDAHYNFHGSGWLRNYIKSSTDNPAEIKIDEMVMASERGNVTMTNGPFLQVVTTAGRTMSFPGSDLIARDGKVNVKVRVQCANWLDINRVQLILNGRLKEDYNFTRRTHPEMFSTEVVKFDNAIPVVLSEDTHIIVAVAGEGLKLGPVVGPDRGEDMPVAVSNPVFVDVDGGGFKPNGDLLDAKMPEKEVANSDEPQE